MLNAIIRWSVSNKLLIGFLLIAWVLLGVFSLQRLPIDAVPDITNNQVQVITQSAALTALEIEKYVTQPLEIELRNIPDLVEIRSISRMGLSVITVVFQDNVSPYLCRQMVAEKIALAENLKSGITPGLAPITTGLGEIYQYTLDVKPGYESQFDLMKIRTLQDWIVKRQLAGIEGVVDISSFGGFVKQYQISVNPNRLLMAGIGFEEVFQALEQNNANAGGGYVEKEGAALYIRTEGVFDSKEAIEQIAVATKGETVLRLGQVATVELGHALRYGAMSKNGKGETVGGIVLMLKGGNSGRTIEGVKARMAEIQSILPAGVVIKPFIDRSKLIEKTISTVRFNLIEGGIIVVVCLVLLLGSFRSGLLVASVIPLSMLFAFTLMNITGTSANLMSLGAIDFGLIVDGAVVIVEAMMVQLALAGVAANRNELAIESSGKIMNTALFGQLIILSVYLPIYALSGIEGKMFMPMALTVSFALGGSIILCLTYIPAASALFLNQKYLTKNRSEVVIHALSLRYQHVLSRVLPHQALVLFTALGLFVFAIWRLSQLGGEFLPKLEEGDFAIEARLPVGSSLSATIEKMDQAEKLLLDSFPEALQVVSKIGTSEIPTDPMPLESADIIVILKEKKDWRFGTMNELSDAVEDVLANVEGVSFEVQQPIEMRFNELMTGVKSDVAVKFFGSNLDSLLVLAERFAAIAPSVEGVASIKVEPVKKTPQVNIKYRRERLASYGLNVATANNSVQMAYAGEKAGLVYEEEKAFDLVVRLEGELRKDLDQLLQLPIETKSGKWVSLNEIAEVKMVDAPTQISRDQAKRRVVVGVNLRNRDVESVVADLRNAIATKIAMPVGYAVEFGGEFENLQHAKQRLQVALPITLLLIFLFLFLAFRSLKLVLLIFTAVPLATIGGIFALELRGMHFSISAAVGFIALFGVAVLNSMLLIQQYKTEALAGTIDPEKLTKASASRLRPVLATALVASLGFLPMAMSNSAGAEVQKPLATVVIGGLITSTLLTLFVLPVLFAFVEKNMFRFNKKALLIIVCLSAFGIAQAQDRISFNLEQALEYAQANNLYVKVLESRKQGLKHAVGTAWEIPQTQVEYQRGQIQFIPIDYTFVVSQSFQLPGVYNRQKQFLEAQVMQSGSEVKVTKRELDRDIKLIFVRHFLAQQRLTLLRKQDSVYRQAMVIADSRVVAGESDRLMLQSLETQLLQLEADKELYSNTLQMSSYSLQQLLNTKEPPELQSSLLSVSLPKSELTVHPLLDLAAQEKRVAEMQLKADKARWWPMVSLGYVNQSVEKNKNLQFGVAGLSVPLFWSPYKARQRAGESLVEQKSLEVEMIQMQLRNRLEMSANQVANLQKRLQLYENNILKQARNQTSLAQRRWQAGQFDFFQFLLVTQQAWQAEWKALDLTEEWQVKLIEQEYLNGE